MNETFQEIIGQMRALGQSMEELVLSVPEKHLSVRPDSDAWSIHEIVFHTRNVVMLAYGLRIRRLVYEVNPLFPDYDEDNELLKELSDQQPTKEIARMIRTEHDLIADLLSLLPVNAWQRAGTHRTSGSLTIQFLAQRIVAHAQEHHDQIKETVQILSQNKG